MKRKNNPFFSRTVRFQPKFRPETGYFVAWHMLEPSALNRSALANRYVRVPSWRKFYEVPQGLWAGLESVYAYFGSHLFNPDSGFWTIFFIEWCVRLAITLIWDVHDIWRLWYLPPALIEAMEQLDYSGLLDSTEFNLEMHSLLCRIK